MKQETKNKLWKIPNMIMFLLVMTGLTAEIIKQFF